MFTVSSLGLMIRISPPDARGRVAGLFSSAFLVGSVGGPVLGSLTAGLGLSAPFVIYGVALLVAAAVVFFSLRNSPLGAPEATDRAGGVGAHGAAASAPTGPRCSPTSRRAGRRSGCASRWCRCSWSTCWAAAPASAGLALATFAIGNVSAVIPSGYLSDRMGRRKLLIVGLDGVGGGDRAGGVHDVAAGVPGRRAT